jgi:hypothetical protein
MEDTVCARSSRVEGIFHEESELRSRVTKSVNAGQSICYSVESLSDNREKWDAYLDKMSDERDASQSCMTSSKLAIFAKFQNMRKVSTCNGTLVPS